MNDQTTPATPAEAATSAAVDAHIAGHTAETTAPLFNRATVQHERAARDAEAGPRADEWRDDNTPAVPLATMPPPPPADQRETNEAVATLRSMGGEHSNLVDSWGSDFSSNLQYARQAFKEVATPELIAAFDASGLGNSPVILEHLAKHGRLAAGFSGDNTIAQRYQPQGTPQRMTTPSSKSAAQAELDSIMEKSPPGSPAYKTKAVQQRVKYLHESIYGTAPAIGKGTRTV